MQIKYEFPHTCRARLDNANRPISRTTNHTMLITKSPSWRGDAHYRELSDDATRRSFSRAHYYRGISRELAYCSRLERCALFQGSIYTNKRKLTKRILSRLDLKVQFTRAALRNTRHVAVDRFSSHRAPTIIPSSRRSQAMRFV